MHRRLLMILLAVAFGCGEPGPSGSSGLLEIPPVDATGTWTGTWIRDAGSVGSGPDSGPLEFTLVQNEPVAVAPPGITGTSTFTDFFDGVSPLACFETGEFLGELLGVRIDTIHILSEPRLPKPTSIEVDGDLDVLGNRMTGSYTVTQGKPLRGLGNGPDCTDFTGTIELTRPANP